MSSESTRQLVTDLMNEVVDAAAVCGHPQISDAVCAVARTGNRFLLSLQPRHGLYPPLPCEEGSEMEGGNALWGTGYHGESFQTGKEPRGDCRCQKSKAGRALRLALLAYLIYHSRLTKYQ